MENTDEIIVDGILSIFDKVGVEIEKEDFCKFVEIMEILLEVNSVFDKTE